MVTKTTELLWASIGVVFTVLCFASSAIADDTAFDPLGIRLEETRVLDPKTTQEAVWKMAIAEAIRNGGEEGRAVETAIHFANNAHEFFADYTSAPSFDWFTKHTAQALNQALQDYQAAKTNGTQESYDGSKTFLKHATKAAELAKFGAKASWVGLIASAGLDMASQFNRKSGAEHMEQYINEYGDTHNHWINTEKTVDKLWENMQSKADASDEKGRMYNRKAEVFRYNMDKVLEPITKVKSTNTATQNLAQRSDVRDSLRIAVDHERSKNGWDVVKKALGPDGSMTTKFADLKKHQQDLHKETMGAIENGQAMVMKFLADEKEGRLIVERDALKKAEDARMIQLKYETSQSSVYIISTLTGFFDEKAGQAISVAGMAGIQIAQTIEKFASLNLQDAGQLLMGSVNLVAGIGQAANMIFKFALGAPDPMMLVMKEIQELRKEVGELRKNMNDRFDRVDRSINRLFASMERGFQGLERRMSGIAYGLEEVREAMDSISRDLDRLNMSTYLYLRAGFQRPIEERLGQCVRSTGEMTLEKFTACLDDFRTFSTRHTADALSTGATAAVIGQSGENLQDPQEFYASLLKELKKGLWGNLAVIAEAAERRFGIRGVRPLQRAPLVNVEDWAYYVNHYLEFIRQNSDYLRYMPDPIMGVTNSILDAGASVQLSLMRLGEEMQVSSGDGNSQVTKSVPESALEDYVTQETAFKSSVVRVRENFEQTRLRGYSLNLGASGNPGYNPEGDFETIPPCHTNNILAHPDTNEAYLMPLFKAPSPQELLLFVEKPIQAASHVGLGRLRVCYKDLWWKDSEKRDYRPTNPKDGLFQIWNLGFIYIDVHFIFDDFRTNKPLVFAKRRIVGKDKFRFKSTYYLEHGSFFTGYTMGAEADAYTNRNAWNFDLAVSDGGKNWRFNTAKAQWPGDLMPRFASESVDIADGESSSGITEIREIWKRFETRMKLSLMDEFKREIEQPSSLQVAADGLTGTKRFMQSAIELSYPVSIEKDDGLRSFFYGRNSIFDSDTIRDLWVSYRTGNGDAQFSVDPEAPGTTVYSRNTQTIEKLKEKVKKMVSERGGKELHPLIQSRRSTLEIIQNVIQAVRPPTSLDAAWASLKGKLDDFRQ